MAKKDIKQTKFVNVDISFEVEVSEEEANKVKESLNLIRASAHFPQKEASDYYSEFVSKFITVTKEGAKHRIGTDLTVHDKKYYDR
tara:strand:- start:5 stop:262 length:258 start_codon:yes stop_codon:yes gene_type:complete